MTRTSKNIETTRVDTSLGVFIVVSHENGVRAGQAFSQQIAGGEESWYILCADWYGAGIPPIEQRIPERGGYASLDDLEQAMVEELGAQMKTDYWSDR